MVKKKLQKGLRKKEKDYSEVPETPSIGELADRIEEDLEDEGLTPFSNDNVDVDYLQLPMDLTEVESSDLGRYFTTFTNQKLYVRSLVVKCAIMRRELDEELDIIRMNIYPTLPAKASIKEKELAVKNNPRAKKIYEKLMYFEEKYRMLDSYLENLIDGITCISREVTRREHDFDSEKRGDNIGKKRR